MSLRKEKLIKHHEGEGQLSWPGGDPLAVRYILDTWSEMIATGSGTTAEMVRHDGFLWWAGRCAPAVNCILDTRDGQYQLTLNEFRSQRARFYCLR
jgi:hypothetical protein